MDKKYAYYIVGAVLIVLIIFAIVSNNRPKESPVNSDQKTEEQINTNQNNQNTNEEQNKTLNGVLRISDDLKKGNLFLENETGKYYIYTSRDFSKYLDKQVEIVYLGSLDSFTLVDIQIK